MAVLHFLAMFGPFLFYIPYAFATGSEKSSYGLAVSLVVAIILLVVSFIISAAHRAGLHKSIFWIILFGLITAVENQVTLVVVMSVVSILDELLFVPLRDKYKRLYETNKEIDKRGVDG